MLKIDENSAGQRIDNFLLRTYKGVPKSHIYRILRSGEVRVNKGRIGAAYRLATGDILRVPPITVTHKKPLSHHYHCHCERYHKCAVDLRTAAVAQPVNSLSKKVFARTAKLAVFSILYEDDYLLVIDKPPGTAVHGGSGISLGVIEQLRYTRQQAKFLELVHRLDRQTSGILLIAKKRAALVNLHEQIRNNQIDKRYLVCVHADWHEPRRIVQLPLYKYLNLQGERRVCVHANGRPACTVFNLVQRFDGYALLEAELKTGRTHQIRVHLAHLGAPIVGDDKYGDFSLNRELAQVGAKLKSQFSLSEQTPFQQQAVKFKRMFLHAFKLRFIHPATGLPLTLTAPLPIECQHFLKQLT